MVSQLPGQFIGNFVVLPLRFQVVSHPLRKTLNSSYDFVLASLVTIAFTQMINMTIAGLYINYVVRNLLSP